MFAPQDHLYNPEKKTGFLYEKLCKLGSQGITVQNTVSEEEKSRIITFFTNCKLPNDRKEIEKEMKVSANIRHKLLRDSASNFPKIFPFYIVNPELVSKTSIKLNFHIHTSFDKSLQILLDFELMYEKIDENGLVKIWPQIQNIPTNQFKLALLPQEMCNPMIDNVLLFLELFPSGRTAFKTSKNLFLKISGDAKMDPALMLDKSIDSPYIIAILSEISSDVKYYIHLEYRLIAVSLSSN